MKDLAWHKRGFGERIHGGLQGGTSTKMCFRKQMVAEMERIFKEIKYLGKRCEGLMQGSEMENRGGIPDKEMGHHRLVMEPMRGKVGGVKNGLSNRTEADSVPNTVLGVLQTFSLHLQNSVSYVELSPFYR